MIERLLPICFFLTVNVVIHSHSVVIYRFIET